MKRSLLKGLMVMALGAIICLPGVAAAGIVLDFNLDPGTNLNQIDGDYALFTWDGWTVEGNGTVSADNGATISLRDGNAFTFDGAELALALNGATSLTVTGSLLGGGTVVFPTDNLTSTLQEYLFENFPAITLLTFNTKTGENPGGEFVMGTFKDAAIPLPPSALLLGTGLLGLVGLGWRRRKNS